MYHNAGANILRGSKYHMTPVKEVSFLKCKGLQISLLAISKINYLPFRASVNNFPASATSTYDAKH